MKGKIVGGLVAAFILYLIVNNPEGFGDAVSTVIGLIFDFFDGVGKVLERVFA